MTAMHEPLLQDIELKEYESIDVQLDSADVAELTTLDKVEVHHLKEKGYTLVAKQFVGIIQLSKSRIIIKPRIEIHNLFYMIEFAEFDPFKIPETIIGESKDFFEFFVTFFLKKLEWLYNAGIYKSYALEEENLQYIKGRILHKENIRYNTVLKHRTYCQYSDLTANNLENKIIKYTLYILGQLTNNKKSQFKILKLYNPLDEVDLDFGIDLESFNQLHFTRLNMHYKPILNLCKLFISNSTVNPYAGKHQFWSFLIDMNKLFEKFVTALLKKEIDGVVSQKKDSDKIKCISENCKKTITIIPDILIRNRLVMDTKYKEDTGNPDFYQIFTYASAYNCNGILVYPKHDKELNEVYKLQDKCITILTIDLTADNLDDFKKCCNYFVKKISGYIL